MDRKLHWCYMMVLLFVPFTETSASSLTPGGREDIFYLKGSTGRSILQDKQACPVNIETLNYTNIQSQCHVPYDVQHCCAALKELACPIRDQFNDMGNDCADRLFKYFDFLHYPDGLFKNICIETKDGPLCPETSTPPETSADASADQRSSKPSHQLMILVPTFILLVLRF